jgi:hypothetical protein
MQVAMGADRIADRALFLVLAFNITHLEQQLRKAYSDWDARTVGRNAADLLTAFWSSTHWLITYRSVQMVSRSDSPASSSTVAGGDEALER